MKTRVSTYYIAQYYSGKAWVSNSTLREDPEVLTISEAREYCDTMKEKGYRARVVLVNEIYSPIEEYRP